MSSWQGNYDSAANTPYWSAATVNKETTTTEAQRLYGNTTANSYTTGETTGVFAVDDNEVQVAGAPHGGWIRRVTGSGGRAGRVTQEVLSVVASFRSDNNSDDTTYPDASITIATQPSSSSIFANVANSNTSTFTVAVSGVKPTGSTVSYVWQYNTADGSVGWTSITNGSAQIANTLFAGNTSASMTVTPADIDANTYVFRVIATATPPAGVTNATAATATSSNAAITIFAE